MRKFRSSCFLTYSLFLDFQFQREDRNERERIAAKKALDDLCWRLQTQRIKHSVRDQLESTLDWLEKSPRASTLDYKKKYEEMKVATEMYT